MYDMVGDGWGRDADKVRGREKGGGVGGPPTIEPPAGSGRVKRPTRVVRDGVASWQPSAATRGRFECTLIDEDGRRRWRQRQPADRGADLCVTLLPL